MTIVALTLILTAFAASRLPSWYTDPLGNPPGIVDHLDFFDTHETLAQGAMERARLVTTPKVKIVLEDSRKDSYPRQGSWTSPPIAAEFSFTELLPSWNADVPPECGVAFEVRARDAASRTWSPWLSIGSWGRSGALNRLETFRGGRIDIDNLRLARPADQFQIKATFLSFSLDAAQVPSLRRIAISYSGVIADASKRPRRAPPKRFREPKDLPVPFRTQKDAPQPLRGQICSPTSVSMVLDYWGIDRPTIDNALAIYDADHDLFGNWGRAVQFAGSFGLDAWLTRFRRWEDVRPQIADGQPIIASIKFKKGEFPSSVLPSTDGHLLVIRGFTASGDVICNDPASKERGKAVIYRASELAHAWFDHGGVAYVIRGPRSALRPASQSSTRAVAENAISNIKPPVTADK